MNGSKIIFFERTNPSANIILIKDRRPVLIDTGFGSDTEDTMNMITGAGVSPDQLDRIVNTHYHCDHVGGNAYLQRNNRIPIAAHKWDGAVMNSPHPDANSSEWLDQPVESYHVDQVLVDGDAIDTGTRTLRILHTPGHTLGHISIYVPEEEILIAGDLFHKDDVGWLNMFREGVAPVERALESLEKLKPLPIRRAYSGHGREIDDPHIAIDHARMRLERWQEAPGKVAWHAMKRIFSFALMLRGGMVEDAIEPYLLTCGWFVDYARYVFQLNPQAFIPVLMEEMIRSGAAVWSGSRFMPSAPYNAPAAGRIQKNVMLNEWRLL